MLVLRAGHVCLPSPHEVLMWAAQQSGEAEGSSRSSLSTAPAVFLMESHCTWLPVGLLQCCSTRATPGPNIGADRDKMVMPAVSFREKESVGT
jgi:hypothetical protein